MNMVPIVVGLIAGGICLMWSVAHDYHVRRTMTQAVDYVDILTTHQLSDVVIVDQRTDESLCQPHELFVNFEAQDPQHRLVVGSVCIDTGTK